MSDEPRRSSSEGIRVWVQAIAIPVVAIAWGAYTFYFKEIWAPAIAPINLTTEVSVKEVGLGGGSENKYQAIELAITATNPSTRDVYLLSNYWRVMGLEIATLPNNERWLDNANTLIRQKMSPANAGTHYEAKKDTLVAAGNVFEDQVLHPNETVSTSFVFYVPQDLYDVLDVEVILPTTAKHNSAEYVHNLTPEGIIESHAYHLVGSDRVQGPEILDFLAAYGDASIQLQNAGSSRQLSLWREAELGSTPMARSP